MTRFDFEFACYERKELPPKKVTSLSERRRYEKHPDLGEFKYKEWGKSRVLYSLNTGSRIEMWNQPALSKRKF